MLWAENLPGDPVGRREKPGANSDLEPENIQKGVPDSGENTSVNKWCRVMYTSSCRRMKLDPYCTLVTKIQNSKD